MVSKWVLLLLAGFALETSPAPSLAQMSEEEAKTAPLTFCRFGPKVKMLEPRREPKQKGCGGGAKIQGVFWECTTPDRVETTIHAFRKTLAEEATRRCKEFCAKLETGCQGRMDSIFRCGLETGREDATIMGKKLGCRNACTGRAFAYCSLYNIGFQTDDVKFMETQPTNCHCFKP
jgi:hypothetical protein